MRPGCLEPEHGGRIRDARRTQVDPGECPVDLDVMQRFPDPLVGQGEPLVQEVDLKQHQDRARGPAGEPGRLVRCGQGDQGDHGTTARISSRNCCLAVGLVPRSNPVIRRRWFMPS